MSRPDATDKLLAAAEALGAREGLAALSIQSIADAAGVSKALVLYHFDDKAALLVALHGRLGADAAARLSRAARAEDALEAWRALVRDEVERGALALLGALANDAALRAPQAREVERAREAAAGSLSTAMLRGVELSSRVGPSLLGRTLLRHLDGVVLAHHARVAVPHPRDGEALEEELDAFALSLLALGR